jgi:hypothetical protein
MSGWKLVTESKLERFEASDTGPCLWTENLEGFFTWIE